MEWYVRFYDECIDTVFDNSLRMRILWIIKAFGIHENEANESNYTTIIKFYAR